jgi:alpha-galactosidase
MSILVHNDNLFLLNTKNTSYAFCVDVEGIVRHLYWGKKIDCIEDFQVLPWEGEQGYHPNIDKKMEECSSFGMMRYKEGSIKVTFSDGVRDFRYVVKSSRVENNLLSIILEDEYYKFRVILYYKVYEEEDIIEKWRVAENFGTDDILLERIYSGEYTMEGTGYKSINCNGTWADEFKAYTDTLEAGKKVYESLRGSSAHVANPYFIIHKDATEDTGEVYYGALSYSGNFKINAEATPYGYLNVLVGISDTDFSWTLKTGDQFVTPSVYSGYSANGFGTMSNTLAAFARRNIMPKTTAERPLRVLYNSWEATTFNVTADKQIKLADKAAAIGTELYVVDDGWFGQRSSDHLGLGDWYVNPEKFPNGLKPLIELVNGLGMDFGIWIEPEMVNENSDLYRAHPDWIYRYATRKVLEGRYQYMLDLTNPEVITYIVDFIDELLNNHNISYIKWDMNRALGECGSPYQKPSEYKTIWYKHVQGFYSIIRTLREKHPKVEFEACASGGGRVDFGCMQYFDEFWTSDNTDALDRLSIQETYSLIYPIKYMRAWVTDAANGGSRTIPLSFRVHCAMCGALGIGMNLNHASDEECKLLKEWIARYKEIRNTVQFGTLYRLKSCHRDDFHAVQYTSEKETVAFAFLIRQARGKQDYSLKLKGLDEKAIYSYTLDVVEYTKTGAYLMNFGLKLHMWGDYFSKCIILTEME